MSSNLPPDVTESMLPGNRPEDEEVEIIMVFTKSEINDLKRYNDRQQGIPIINRGFLWYVVANMIEQFGEDGL